MELYGRVALVTGGSRGIGAATARLLAESGADVAIVSRSGDEAAEQVISQVQTAGRRGISLVGDMGQAADCRRVVEEAKHHNLTRRIPLHREGTPEQIAEGIRFLATNDYITGENVTVDGGLTMRIR